MNENAAQYKVTLKVEDTIYVSKTYNYDEYTVKVIKRYDTSESLLNGLKKGVYNEFDKKSFLNYKVDPLIAYLYFDGKKWHENTVKEMNKIYSKVGKFVDLLR